MLILEVLFAQVFLLNNVWTEWVDMPQFSDEEKVYRVPPKRQNHFYKFIQENVENQFFYPYENITYEDSTIETIMVNQSDGDSYHIKKDIKMPIVLEDEETFLNDTDKSGATTASKTNKETEEITDPEMNEETEENKSYFNDSIFSNGPELLKYLPVDILKNVHRTLVSQPTSSEGKIKFLRNFEHMLIQEIETRISNSITLKRDKRGAEHYDQGYDHEHAAGFPSIEGALMAISFLTFAVYLVRLVMLLFRNMNNNMATTTGATVFLGRRKRSTNTFNEEMAMILDGVHSFSSRL